MKNYKNLIKVFSQKSDLLKDNKLFRTLEQSESTSEINIKRGSKNFISFACNDYLGLSHNELVKKSAIDAINKYGVGARASRFVTGNNPLYTKLESALAKFYGCDESLVFSSGYACAIGVISALAEEGDLIVADKLIHACLIDGAKLSGAKLMRFNHNDTKMCEEVLKQNRQNFKKCLIISETVFSMDGDVGKIKELISLALKYNSILLSDDAHGIGKNIFPHPIHLQMGTLSKSLGGLGGFVAGNKVMIEYIKQFARSLKYSTALPPSLLASSIEAIKIIQRKNLAQKSLENAKYFCKLIGMPEPQSSIVVIIVGDNSRVIDLAKKVYEKGFLIAPIRHPTVPKNQARLRLTFSASHHKSDIRNLVKILKELIDLS